MMDETSANVTVAKPELSELFKKRNPSAIRLAQIEFMKRTDGVDSVNTAIGNVSLPVHPALKVRMADLCSPESPFAESVVKYTATIGLEETRNAFLNIIGSSGFSTDGLKVQVTDGGSQAMELVVLAVCGPAASTEKPLLLIDPAYTNYNAMANRVSRRTISVTRHLQEDGRFSLPDVGEIEKIIKINMPGALVVIPYDNPTGQLYDQESMVLLGRLCVKHNMWLVSDESYRELNYTDQGCTSVWGLTENEVPGIQGRRVSIETSSKVWNACGLRVGALVTDNVELHEKSVAEYTANLCGNAIGQYVFGALAHETHSDLKAWYRKQREYYKPIMTALNKDLKKELPGIIVSEPDASIYSVVDVRNIAKPGFDARDFVLYCAREGRVEVEGKERTLLVTPMAGFYSISEGEKNPGKTQMRIAFVETPDRMRLVPRLFRELFLLYESARN
jgi:aspartate aminotransferase